MTEMTKKEMLDFLDAGLTGNGYFNFDQALLTCGLKRTRNMSNLKETLVTATEDFDVAKALNESKEGMGIDAIAKELGTTKQNIYRALVNGMCKMYRQVKKDNKCNPAQAMKILMDFFDADATEIMGYLDKDCKAEVSNYVKAHGAD